MDKNKKNLLYVVLGIIGFLVFVIVSVVVIVSMEPLSYGDKYYDEYGSQYFIFNSDGTCESKSSIDCNYELEDDILTITTHIDTTSLLGYNAEYIYEFEVINKKEIKRVKMKILGYESNDGLGDIWKVGEKNFKTTTTTTVKNVPFMKSYTVLTNNGGAKGEIRFANGGECFVDFSQFANKKSVAGTNLSVVYVPGTCIYTMLDDYNLEISYTGYGALFNSYYDSYSKKMIDVETQRWNIFDGMRIKFSNDYNKFDILNGKFEHTGGEVYFYYFSKSKDYKEEVKTTTSTTTVPKSSSINDEKTNKTTTTKKNTDGKESTTKSVTTKNDNKVTTKDTTTTTTTKKQRKVDYISVSIGMYQYDAFQIVIESSEPNYRGDNYEVIIDGESFNSTAYGRMYAGAFYFDGPGEECVSVSVVDEDGNKKSFGNKCITFKPSTPKYKASVNQATGGYYLSFSNTEDASKTNTNHYNNIKNVTIYHNGDKVTKYMNDSFHVGAWNSCNHTIKVVNKYGLSQTINVTC